MGLRGNVGPRDQTTPPFVNTKFPLSTLFDSHLTPTLLLVIGLAV